MMTEAEFRKLYGYEPPYGRFVYVCKDLEGLHWNTGFLTLDAAMNEGVEDSATRDFRPVCIWDRDEGTVWNAVLEVRWKQP